MFLLYELEAIRPPIHESMGRLAIWRVDHVGILMIGNPPKNWRNVMDRYLGAAGAPVIFSSRAATAARKLSGITFA